jgi:hypothetical protein
MRACCWYLIAILILGTCAVAQERTLISSSIVPTDAQSLQMYLGAMLHAYQAGDVSTFNELANDLKLPKADEWFHKSFGPDQANAMNENYRRSFQAFCSRLAEDFESSGNIAAELTVQERKSKLAGTSPSLSAPTPKVDLKINSYKCVLTVPGKGRTEWMDSFVVVDGSLRYIGQGAFPFWAGPLRIKVKKTQ